MPAPDVSHPRPVEPRTLGVAALAVALGLTAALASRALVGLIAVVTNLAWFGRPSSAPASPADNTLGVLGVLVPVLGGLVVGLLARHGSKAIRGHGIPEAMEQVLENESRVAARLTWLKPLSAAIAIGTGGPFGAEGPIIATGGALGSVLGQILPASASERRTLLAAGAAAGMAATFGSPFAAVLLAIELLLFELSPRSLGPVALAAATAAGARLATEGGAPVFALPETSTVLGSALVVYVLVGAVAGLVAVLVTRLVYLVEEGFERLPVPWPLWPALGGLAVGLVGLVAPKTLGVGYDNISDLLSDRLALRAVVVLVTLKLVSWSIALGSGTSGGTLAPLLTLGSGLGVLLGRGAAAAAPGLGVDRRIAAAVGMASLFAGASRAVLASAVFAFETTQRPGVLLPLLGGCAAAHLVSCLLAPHSIMTEKIARRGIRVPHELGADELARSAVERFMSTPAVSLPAESTLDAARAWLASGVAGTRHQGFPLVGADGSLRGVVTRREILEATGAGDAPLASLAQRDACAVLATDSLRLAVEAMARLNVGRLPVVAPGSNGRLVGVLTRSDLVRAQRRRV